MTGISQIILAYEDAPALPRLIRDLDATLQAQRLPYEIIVVDDGSGDDTVCVVGALAEELPAVRLIRHEVNRGVGAGFRTGVLAARFDVIGYTDGDAQYVASDVPALIAELREADAASGWRAERADPLHRIFVSRCYNAILRQLYGLSLRDTNSGLKFYRRPLLHAVLPIASDGPFFDAEVMIKAVHAGFRVVEIPVQHRPRRHGRARGASLASITRALRELSSDSMRRYVVPGFVAGVLHRLLVVAASSIARIRWARAAATSPADARRADI